MKNRPLSFILIGFSLAAWLAQVMILFFSVPSEVRLLAHDKLCRDALCQLIPYGILCSLAAFVSVPKFGKWLLCAEVVCMAWAGVSAWIDYSTSGSCMCGFALLAGYAIQYSAAIAAFLLALISKAVACFRGQNARVA